MKTKMFAVLPFMLFALALVAQTTVTGKWIYGYVGAKPTWLTLGPTLAISPSGQLDAVVPVSKLRVRDVELQYDATAKGWTVPPGASNLTVMVNGIRFRSAGNWNVVSGKLMPVGSNMLPEHEVTADFDQ